MIMGEEMDTSIEAFLAETVERSLDQERQARVAETRAGAALCESPIEQRLLCALAFIGIPVYSATERRLERPVIISPETDYLGDYLPLHQEWLTIATQMSVLTYRVDFLLTAKFWKRDPVKLVVECDGHDFHERTKEQAARDKRRDREMVAAGYYVFRFTGSEIHRNATSCADEVSRFLSRLEYEGRD